MKESGATGLGQELGAETDHAPRWHDVFHAHPTRAVVDHLFHPALAQSHQLRDDAEVVLWDVNGESLDWFVDDAVDLTRDDLRLADGELAPFATHHLHQHRELRLAGSLHYPGVRALGLPDANQHISDQRGRSSCLQHSSRELAAAFAGQRSGVDSDG